MPLNLETRNARKEFIVTGIFPDETRYLVADSTGRVIQRSGNIPMIMTNVPVNVRHNAALARVAVHPQDNRVALAYKFTDRIGIYSQKGELLQIIDHPERDTDPGLVLAYTDSGQPYMAQDQNTRLSYLNILADDRYIYGLYSGKRRKESNASFAQHLFVYDWEGELASHHRLEYFVRSCTLTDKPGILLCLKGSTDYRESFFILKYQVEIPTGY